MAVAAAASAIGGGRERRWRGAGDGDGVADVIGRHGDHDVGERLVSLLS